MLVPPLLLLVLLVGGAGEEGRPEGQIDERVGAREARQAKQLTIQLLHRHVRAQTETEHRRMQGSDGAHQGRRVCAWAPAPTTTCCLAE